MNFDFSKESQSIQLRRDFIETSFANITRAMSHFKAYRFGELEPEHRKQRLEPLIRFQAQCFQSYFVIQIAEMFIPSTNYGKAYSSLIVFNNKLHNIHGVKYTQFDEVKEKITLMQDTSIYKLIDALRDRAYSHSDNHEYHQPLTFRFFTEEQFKEIMSLVIDMEKVHNNILQFYGLNITFHNFYNDTKPRNYLNNNFKAREYLRLFGSYSKINQVMNSLKGIDETVDKLDISGHEKEQIKNALLSIRDSQLEMFNFLYPQH